MSIDQELDQYFCIDHAGQFYQGQFHTREALYTSYEDLLKIYNDLNFKQGTFVDLGSGNCRASFLFKTLNPNLKVISIDWNDEVISQAQIAAKVFEIDSSQFICGDLNEIDIPRANAYFLYQSTDELLYRIMEKLKNYHPFTLYAIESHGDLITKLSKDFSWVKKVKTISQSSSKRYDPMIYRFDSKAFHPSSNEISQLRSGKKLLFSPSLLMELRWSKEFLVLIEEENYSWVASTYQTQSGLSAKTYEFQYPNRNIPIHKIKNIFKCPPQLEPFVQERFRPQSKIRKIILAPHLQIEYTDKGRININQL